MSEGSEAVKVGLESRVYDPALCTNGSNTRASEQNPPTWQNLVDSEAGPLSQINTKASGENELDSGWLAILKASAWQLLGLSLALSVFWLLLRVEILPPWDSIFVIYCLPLAILITAGLGLASLVEQATKLATAALKKHREAREQDQRITEHQRKFIEHIPYMTDNELAIYGYLLTNSRKSFTAEMDCGHATSLYKRRFIQSDAQNGHSYGPSEFPFSVPDHIWSILEEKQDQFPNEFKDSKLPWFRRRI